MKYADKNSVLYNMMKWIERIKKKIKERKEKRKRS